MPLRGFLPGKSQSVFSGYCPTVIYVSTTGSYPIYLITSHCSLFSNLSFWLPAPVLPIGTSQSNAQQGTPICSLSSLLPYQSSLGPLLNPHSQPPTDPLSIYHCLLLPTNLSGNSICPSSSFCQFPLPVTHASKFHPPPLNSRVQPQGKNCFCPCPLVISMYRLPLHSSFHHRQLDKKYNISTDSLLTHSVIFNSFPNWETTQKIASTLYTTEDTEQIFMKAAEAITEISTLSKELQVWKIE